MMGCRIAYLAACAAITRGLGIPLPHLERRVPNPQKEFDFVHERNRSISGIPIPPPSPPNIRSVLVLGGSSGVGACAIQLLKMALPDAVIISTNSPEHNKKLVELGAATCVDRNLSTEKVVEGVRKAAPEGKGVDAILDAVAGAQEDEGLFGVLRGDKTGLRLYSYVATGREDVKVPNGVKSVEVFAHMMFMPPPPAPSVLANMANSAAMGRLGEMVEEGKFKLPLEVEVVGRGLEDIAAGLEKLKGGVSGTKLVVSV